MKRWRDSRRPVLLDLIVAGVAATLASIYAILVEVL
jgi:hypothetical protein